MPTFWSQVRYAERRDWLLARARILTSVRRWFCARRFTEVQPAALQASPGNETHLHGFKTALVLPDGSSHDAYLHTSPEFAMKKLIDGGRATNFFADWRFPQPRANRLARARVCDAGVVPGARLIGAPDGGLCCGNRARRSYRWSEDVCVPWSGGKSIRPPRANRRCEMRFGAMPASTFTTAYRRAAMPILKRSPNTRRIAVFASHLMMTGRTSSAECSLNGSNPI